MLPKGNISHEELSNLLFVYVGIGSDIMELFVLFEEDYVLQDQPVVYAILAAWTGSLLQFTMVLTATRRRVYHNKSNNNGNYDYDQANIPSGCRFCATEIWSIIVMALLQDGSFLAVRLYVMITNKTITYTVLFFTAKNILMLAVSFYRLVVLGCCPNSGQPKYDTTPRRKDKPPNQNGAVFANSHAFNSMEKANMNHENHSGMNNQHQNLVSSQQDTNSPTSPSQNIPTPPSQQNSRTASPTQYMAPDNQVASQKSFIPFGNKNQKSKEKKINNKKTNDSNDAPISDFQEPYHYGIQNQTNLPPLIHQNIIHDREQEFGLQSFAKVIHQQYVAPHQNSMAWQNFPATGASYFQNYLAPAQQYNYDIPGQRMYGHAAGSYQKYGPGGY